MTDRQNHLELARSALEDAATEYGATPRENAAIENALIGIGHALLAIHEEMLRSARAAEEYDRETDRMYDRLNPGPVSDFRLGDSPPGMEPPADISGIPLDLR